MKKGLFAILIFAMMSAISYAYIPSDIEKLNKSDNCQKCDITEYIINTYKNESILAVKLDGSYWTAAYIRKVDFKNKSLVHSNFVVASIFETNFDESDLSESNFSNSMCIECSLKNTKLKNSQFFKVEFEYAQFTNADLSNANLEKANFNNAEFMNVNFSGANLSGADLSRTNLYGSNITQAQLDSLLSYQCATMPDGSVYDKNGVVDCAR